MTWDRWVVYGSAILGLLATGWLLIALWRDARRRRHLLRSVTGSTWMTKDQRAQVLQYHAIKSVQHQKAKAGYTKNF